MAGLPGVTFISALPGLTDCYIFCFYVDTKSTHHNDWPFVWCHTACFEKKNFFVPFFSSTWYFSYFQDAYVWILHSRLPERPWQSFCLFFFLSFFYFFVFFQFYLRFLALFRLFSILFPFFWLFFVFLTFFLFYSLIFHFFFLKKENFPTLTFWLTLFLPLIHFPSHSIIRKMRYPFHSLFLARQNRGRPLFTCISTIFGGFSVHSCGFSFAPSWQMTGNHDTCQMIISIIHIYATLKCFLSFSWIHPAMYNIDKSLKRPKNVPIMKKHILCCNECRHCEGKLIP